MNRATKIMELPALTVDQLKANGVLIDNIFARLWRESRYENHSKSSWL